jgi:demethylmenaquinone methyltransferase / 2-methoxy-6-polyprenyl-1,4-benzoquinol methylase
LAANSNNRDVAEMFDRISPTYDLLNHLFSFGIDRRWRARAIKSLGLRAGHVMLDCSAGTGDMSLAAHHRCSGIQTVLLDPARRMLAIADSKAELIPARDFRVVQGAAESLPFRGEAFDCFTVAFGIRNFSDLRIGVSELHRILKPGGRGAVIEFTPERSTGIDRVFAYYLRNLMPKIGGLISRDREAYSYLARTVENFSTRSELTNLFRDVGFVNETPARLSAGIATLFCLTKP